MLYGTLDLLHTTIHKYYIDLNLTAYINMVDLHLQPEASLMSVFSIVPNISVGLFLKEYLLTMPSRKTVVITSVQISL